MLIFNFTFYMKNIHVRLLNVFKEHNMYLEMFRKSLNLSQSEMATQLGITRSYYSKIEKGYRNPSYDFMRRLKDKYPQVNIDKMFFQKNKPCQ